MYAQIIIEYQTQKEHVSCEYCIGKENCYLRLKIGEKVASEIEPSTLAALFCPSFSNQ